MINMDAPRHARLRRIVSRGFTPRVLAHARGRRASARAAAIVDARDRPGRVRLRHRDRRAAAAPDHLRHDGHSRRASTQLRLRADQHHPRRRRSRVRRRPGTNPIVAALDRRAGARGADERARRASARKHPTDDLTSAAAQRRGRRRDASPTRSSASFFVLLVVGRQRDHAQRDQPRHEGALPTTPTQRRDWAADFEARRADRGRGDRALGDAGDPLPPHRDARHRDRRPEDRGRREGRDVVQLGEPRRGGVRRPVPLRRRRARRTSTSASAARARTSASAPTSRAARSR